MIMYTSPRKTHTHTHTHTYTHTHTHAHDIHKREHAGIHTYIRS